MDFPAPISNPARNASITSTTSTSTISPPSHSPALQPTTSHSSSNTLAPTRPKMSSRKSSGTIIVPREHPKVELSLEDEVFDEDDARAMSPRRSSQDLEKMSRDARELLSEHAKALQLSLLEIFNRIEAVKEEHDKLDNNNKFLQKYIGDLMSTSKITSTGSSGAGGGAGSGGRKK